MITDFSPLWISLKTAIIATIITFFLGITVAYWMHNFSGKGKSFIEAILLLPLILPPTVVGFLLLIILGRNSPVGVLLAAINIRIVFTWYAAIITASIVAFPIMYKTALGAFAQIDANLPQAARTLGASESQVFWRVSLPLALPGIIAGATLAFARALGEFGATLMLAGNIPRQTQTIPMAIYFAVETGSMSEAWLWCLVMVNIALSGLMLVNFLSQTRQISRSSLRQKRNKNKKRVSSHNWDLQTSQPYLVVDIYKRLPGFVLDISLTTPRQVVGILGGSGAGKSLVLRCIAGIETPDRGRIILNGRVLFDSEAGINLPPCDRRVGFLFQNYALFPHLTVAENIAFGLPSLTRQDIEAKLAAVHLSGFSDRNPQQLSGGQQQRVALARALASQPEILLLDEPFSALDTHLRSQIEKLLLDTLEGYQGISLFVSHNLEELYRVCNDLLVMEKGNVIAAGSKQDIFTHPCTPTVARLTGCKNFSRARPKSSKQIFALDWNCSLTCSSPIPENLVEVGVRAHQLIFTHNPHQPNTFPCWLAKISETPHRVTLYLTLERPPNHPGDHHLQAEVFKEKWLSFKDDAFPWYVCLHPQRLILLQEPELHPERMSQPRSFILQALQKN